MLDAWIEWKKLCALDLCSESSRQTLQEFGRLRFAKYLSRYSYGSDSSGCDNPWHLLETHMTVKNSRQGKRYKEWLFARTESSKDPAIDVIQGGASLIMRDVTREFLRRECSPRNMLSLDQPLVNTGEFSFTLMDILPAALDPVSVIHIREYEQLASKHAKVLLESISDREKIVIVAKQLGLSLAHNVVEKAAGCKKSALNDSYRKYLERISGVLKNIYREDDNESVLALTLLTVQRISEEIIEQIKAENSLAEFFMLKKG